MNNALKAKNKEDMKKNEDNPVVKGMNILMGLAAAVFLILLFTGQFN